MDREEFRLDRVDRMDALSLAIFRAVDDAQAQTIGGDDFAEALEPLLEEAFYAEYMERTNEFHADTFAIADGPAAAWRWAWQRIKPGLTAATDLADPRRIADWLGTALVNAAQVLAAKDVPGKEWVSRKDDRVRPFHVEADGQVVKLADPFTVCGGRKVDFPGQPVGDPDCWINCRCVVRVVATVNYSHNVPVEQATFAADPDVTGVCIVALPAVDDPVNAASSEPVAHMTVIWLGKQVFAPEDRDTILDGIAGAAEGISPVDAPIVARETLGDDDADVVKVDPGPLAGARDKMLANPAIGAAHNAVEQYPQWTPHVTMGYPDSPATGDPGQSIKFDRLALWDKEYEGEEFPMSAPTVDEVDVEDITDLPEPQEDDEMVVSEPVPWNGVLVPEGVPSGDGRRFADNAITWRELPLPLLWQESSGMGHDGSVIVGQISDIWRDGNLIHASGTFANNDAAEKVIGLIAEGHLRGVSVDVDNAEMAVEDEEEMLFSTGRISAATLCSIPAFSEAFVSLGAGDRSPAAETVPAETVTGEVAEVEAISEQPWDGSASRFTPEQWKSSCCLHLADEVEPKSNHKLPIKEPEGALSRAGTHAAAARVNQVDAPPEKKEAAKSTLRGAYNTLKEEPPDVLKASGVVITYNSAPGNLTVNSAAATVTYTAGGTFARGPGWVTDPVATKRIHDYWTKPGHEGYAKIAWGTPGDFRRLRAYLSKYIGAKFLNRTTAQWHYDALGYWPGELGKPGNPVTRASGESGPSVILASVPSVTDYRLPSEWFIDPQFTASTPLTVTDDGRVFGHLAEWGVCHIGIPGTCVEAPHSEQQYAYFHTGVIETSAGPVPCGQITMDTGHASRNAKPNVAAAHYDNTGSVVADIVCGEDAYGIWVAGALRDNVPEEKRRALQAGALSGDWRLIRGNLELVAALAVNVPGFPIPRTGLAASGGVQTSLVAAGVVAPEAGDGDDVAEFVRAVVDEVEARVARRARAARLLEGTKELRVAALMQQVEV